MNNVIRRNMKMRLVNFLKILILAGIFMCVMKGLTGCMVSNCQLNFGKPKSFGRFYLMQPSDSLDLFGYSGDLNSVWIRTN